MKHTAIISMLFISLSLAAQERGTSASYALPFSYIGHDPVTEAMAGAGMLCTSSPSNAASANPASIPFSEFKGDISASYQNWAPDGTSFYSGSSAFNVNGKFGLSAAFTIGQDSPVTVTDADGVDTGTFTPSKYQAGIGASWKFVDWMSAGLAVRLAGQSIAPGTSLDAVSADFFLMARKDGLKGAAGIRGISSSVSSVSGQEYSVPGTFTAALGYEKDFGIHSLESEIRSDIVLPAQGISQDEPLLLSAGACYTFKGMVSLRAGYHFGGEGSVLPSYASAGLGFRYAGMHLDFACLFASAGNLLNDTLTLGIGYRF